MDEEAPIKSGSESFVGPAGDHAVDPHRDVRDLSQYSTPSLHQHDLDLLQIDNPVEPHNNDANIADQTETDEPSLPSNRRPRRDEHGDFVFNMTPAKVQRLEENSDFQNPDLERDDDDESMSNEAEEIVQKICKNGKVMTLTEGDNFIKVIVYEDENENADDALSTDDMEKDCGDRNDGYRDGARSDGYRGPTAPPHILADKSNTYSRATDTDMSQLSAGSSPRAVGGGLLPTSSAGDTSPWYNLFSTDPQLLGSVSAASAIQSNFAQTVTQFAPSGLFTCNVGDIMPPGHMTLPTDSRDKKQVDSTCQNEGRIFCTPHPKNGQLMYYIAQSDKDDMSYVQSLGKPVASSSPMSASKDSATSTSKRTSANPAHIPLALNSSGEEIPSPMEMVATPRSSHLHNPGHIHNPMSLIELPSLVEENGRIREQHNQKERRRRARIKEACSLMRQLVPGMSDKTDKATVFEFAARYVHFLKSFTGTEHDKDFLMKYSPY